MAAKAKQALIRWEVNALNIRIYVEEQEESFKTSAQQDGEYGLEMLEIIKEEIWFCIRFSSCVYLVC